MEPSFVFLNQMTTLYKPAIPVKDENKQIVLVRNYVLSFILLQILIIQVRSI